MVMGTLGETRVCGRWGAVALVVLVYSGQLKAHPLLAWLPVDLTILAAALTVVAVAASRVRGGPAHRLVFVPFVLWLVFALPLFYSLLPESAVAKLTLMYTVTLLIAVAPFYLLRTRRQLSAFLWSSVVLGVIAAVLVLTNRTTVVGYVSRYVLEGSDTIGTARVVGAAALICLLFGVMRGMRPLLRLTMLGAAGMLLLVTIASGSRGPVVSVAVALALTVLLSPAFRKYRGRVLVVIAAAGVAAVWWASVNATDGYTRITSYLTGTPDDSTVVRGLLTDEAWTGILTNPFGIGWGNFNAGNGVFTYPHNVFLEVPAEAGWLAGALFIAIVVVALYRFWRLSVETVYAPMFALMIFAVLNAAVSSDFNGNRLLIVMTFAALAVRLPSREPKQEPFRALYPGHLNRSQATG